MICYSTTVNHVYVRTLVTNVPHYSRRLHLKCFLVFVDFVAGTPTPIYTHINVVKTHLNYYWHLRNVAAIADAAPVDVVPMASTAPGRFHMPIVNVAPDHHCYHSGPFVIVVANIVAAPTATKAHLMRIGRYSLMNDSSNRTE